MKYPLAIAALALTSALSADSLVSSGHGMYMHGVSRFVSQEFVGYDYKALRDGALNGMEFGYRYQPEKGVGCEISLTSLVGTVKNKTIKTSGLFYKDRVDSEMTEFFGVVTYRLPTSLGVLTPKLGVKTRYMDGSNYSTKSNYQSIMVFGGELSKVLNDYVEVALDVQMTNSYGDSVCAYSYRDLRDHFQPRVYWGMDITTPIRLSIGKDSLNVLEIKPFYSHEHWSCAYHHKGVKLGFAHWF